MSEVERIKLLPWEEKYRPRKIEDVILPKRLSGVFKSFVDSGDVPNLLLHGPPGIGKTTVARALLEETGSDYMLINASKEGNIETLRTKIQEFAQTVSFSGGKKYVILDEADHLNRQSTQPALRAFMTEFASNCGFVFTANYPNSIIEPLWSRCAVVGFELTPDEKQPLAAAFFHRASGILTGEGVSFDRQVLSEVIVKYFPDWRRVLNELQAYAKRGSISIDSGILANSCDVDVRDLIEAIRSKNFTAAREWVGVNSAIDQRQLFRALFDSLVPLLIPQSQAAVIAHLGKYQYYAAFVADQQVNAAACVAEVMADARFA